jgi:glycosyltransferase involved in cell wall biosynthesis
MSISKVTVVIRTYNRPQYLIEALASVQLQTYKNWEVLIFDDSGSDANFYIYKMFKDANKNSRVMYITTRDYYDLFKNSWLIAPDLSNGELMIRLDDDDLLVEDALEFLVDVYNDNPELEFTYGSSVFFEKDVVRELVETKNPFEHDKTKDTWAPYTIPNNKPWKEPWMWFRDYYETPQSYTSLIHAAKANQLSVYHAYVMRTESIKKVKNQITITSNFVDDLEFFGTLDYLGLGHNSIKKILTFVRMHTDGKVSDPGKKTLGQSMYDENFRVRDKVDEIRPSGFVSKIIPIEHPKNINKDTNLILENKLNSLQDKIKIVTGNVNLKAL